MVVSWSAFHCVPEAFQTEIGARLEIEGLQQWWHIAYVCLKPWRVVAVKVAPVNRFAQPLDENNMCADLFVRPCLEDGRCRVLPIQRVVSEFDPNLAYDMNIYTLSSDLTPMAIMKGHARIHCLKQGVRLWRGMLQEAHHEGKAPRKKKSDEGSAEQNPPPALFGWLADEAEQQSDDGSQESAESEADNDMTEDLLQAAVGITVAEPASQPLRRSSSVTSSSSSTSQQDPPESSQQGQPAPQMDARAITRIVNPATIASWHGFRLTWVPARKSSGHGSWQGTCPYHKKSLTGTSCKRLFQSLQIRQKQWARHCYR